MASESNSLWKAYRFPIILLTGIVIGCIVGAVMGKDALVFKPLGDVFINAMFMVVVPLVFSTICSAVANMSSMERLGKVMKSLVLVFLVTGAIAAILMLVTVTLFPPAAGTNIQLQAPGDFQALSTADQIVKGIYGRRFRVAHLKARYAAADHFHHILRLLPPDAWREG